MDVHTRRLRYSVVLAEELHFTRAASRLFVAQQSLSRQIRELEDDLGAVLFDRTRRSVALTAAGAAFLVRVRLALQEIEAGVDEIRTMGAGQSGRLRIGFGMGAALELTPLILEEFARTTPDAQVEMQEYPLPDQTAGLAEGWADVAFVRPPLAESDIAWEPLFIEPRVLTTSARHPLASRRTVSVADLLDIPLALGRSQDQAYRDFWSLAEYRTGEDPVLLHPTSTNTEELELVAAGYACTINPAAVLRYLPHPSVRYVPIRDVTGSTVAVAWRTDRLSPLVMAFRAVAKRVKDVETDTVRWIEDPFGPHEAAVDSA